MSQVEGGFVMGLGLNLTEEILYDTNGALVTHNTWEYKPPSALDIPLDMRVSRRREKGGGRRREVEERKRRR
jgi:xanthine dehydrogenase/oxidase